MKNKWTSGAYTLFRAVFGFYLTIHFLYLIPWGKELFSNEGMLPSGQLSPLLHLFPNLFLINDSPSFVTSILFLGSFSSLCFSLGKADRIAAIFCWYLLASLFGRNPFISNPSLPYVGWLLLAHACIPKTQEDKTWKMPQGIFLAAWIAMAAGYSYSGVMKLSSPSWIDGTALKDVLENPLARVNLLKDLLSSTPDFLIKGMTWSALLLEILFLPLALISPFRKWIWLMMLAMHLNLLLLIRFADLTFGMVMLHLFTFDPGWIKPKKENLPLEVFYDGLCGLCHGFVKFTLRENINDISYIFRPLQGNTFKELLIAKGLNKAPVALAAYNPETDKLVFKTEAVIAVLERLGGVWRLLSFSLRLFPLPLADLGYDLFASQRMRFFKKPNDTCLLFPKHSNSLVLND